MNVSLPISLEEFVRQKVEAGEFDSADEVVCEGLRLLQQHESWKTEASRRIDVGWEQARSGQLRTPEQARQNLGSRKADWKRQQGG